MNQINKNLENINYIRKETNAKIFLALKGFSNDNILKYFIDKLDGVSSSGLFESKLGKELNSKVSTFSTAYKNSNIKEICENSEYIIFNSVNQYKKYFKYAQKENCSVGIRINPEYTELPEEFGANTCKKDSHLGIRKNDMPAINEFCKGKIEGIHLHTMCEQKSDTLERTIAYLIKNYDEYLKNIKWLNLGGGQLLGSFDYDTQKAIHAIKMLTERYEIDVILEPCEGIMLNSGYYVSKVIDLLYNNTNIAIIDGSAVCHMTDWIYRGWDKEILGTDDSYKNNYKIIGCSCYAGDSFGNYNFQKRLKIGDKIIFTDTAHYTLVKSNMFNGIAFPSLYIIDSDKNMQKVKEYDYECFKMIL